MAFKETPTNIRVYYKSMRTKYTLLKEAALNLKDIIEDEIKQLHTNVLNYIEDVKNSFTIDLNNYKEFTENKYIDGKFLHVARGLYLNKKGGYTITSYLLDIYFLAKKQKELYDLEHDVRKYDKLINLKFKEYSDILDKFYIQVHKELINGNGYVFEGDLGWICINRCHITNGHHVLDFKATKENKAKLLAEGKRIYNKEEAEWCKQNNIPYDGIDCRVFKDNEYCYEIPLIGCKLPNGRKHKLTITDRRGPAVRGKSNVQLIEECNFDKDKICELPVDVKSKLSMCLEVDKMLYLNFIRNENQKSINSTSLNRKD